MKLRLGEINIICTDLERAKAFYCGLLGMEAIEYEGESALHCRLAGTHFLLLATAKQPADLKPYSSKSCISFDLFTDDLVGLVARLKESGAEFAKESDGECAFVFDPDGNVVELLQV